MAINLQPDIRTEVDELAFPAVPPGIGWATTLKPGHIVSNEPGFYLEGEWGIRLESVIVCKEIEVSNCAVFTIP